jgi:hypothetical protein
MVARNTHGSWPVAAFTLGLGLGMPAGESAMSTPTGGGSRSRSTYVDLLPGQSRAPPWRSAPGVPRTRPTRPPAHRPPARPLTRTAPSAPVGVQNFGPTATSPYTSPGSTAGHVNPGQTYTCEYLNLCELVWDPTTGNWELFKQDPCNQYSVSYWNDGGYFSTTRRPAPSPASTAATAARCGRTPHRPARRTPAGPRCTRSATVEPVRGAPAHADWLLLVITRRSQSAFPGKVSRVTPKLTSKRHRTGSDTATRRRQATAGCFASAASRNSPARADAAPPVTPSGPVPANRRAAPGR